MKHLNSVTREGEDARMIYETLTEEDSPVMSLGKFEIYNISGAVYLVNTKRKSVKTLCDWERGVPGDLFDNWL